MIYFRVQKPFMRLLKLQNGRCISSRKISISYCSMPGDIPLSGLCVGELINQRADQSGDQTAIISVPQNISKTYSELRKEVDRLASGLISIGLKKGDRLGMYSPNCYEWPLTQFAAAKAGLILVNINPASQPQELEYCLKKAGCKSLIMWDAFKTMDYYKILCDIVPELPNSIPGKIKSSKLPNLESVIMISEDKKNGVLEFNDVLGCGNKESDLMLSKLIKEIQFDDPVNIQFTSGTTGTPKGAALTHHNIVNNIMIVGRRFGFEINKPTLCCQVPLFHSFGCVLGGLNALYFHGTCVLPTLGFDSISSLKAIEEHKCSVIFGTPTMYVDMIRHYKSGKFDISHLKKALIGGAAPPAALVKDLKNILGIPHILVGFGITETSPGAALTNFTDDLDTVANGWVEVIDHTEAKVIDSKGHIVPVSALGELCIRGHNTFLEYWEEKNKTAEVLDSTGWYHTGDMATMKENGRIKIVGRIKDMIIRGGENIYPLEVENFLNTHPAILDVHICGVPDKRLGEEACAWICLNDGMNLTEEDIKSFCKGKISHFKIPRYIMFVEDFPKTQSGKVKKFEMYRISIEKLELGSELL